MNQEEFTENRSEISKIYRAVCYTDNRHWIGSWRNSYAEAYTDADKHRYNDQSNNEFHDIRIIEQVNHEAKIY